MSRSTFLSCRSPFELYLPKACFGISFEPKWSNNGRLEAVVSIGFAQSQSSDYSLSPFLLLFYSMQRFRETSSEKT